MKIIVGVAIAIALSCACVPLPDYAGRRLAVDAGSADENEDAQAMQQQQQQQQGSHDTGVPAAMGNEDDAAGFADATRADFGVNDQGGAIEEPDAGELSAQDAGDTTTPDAGAPVGGAGAFGAVCAVDADCASNVCRTFGQLGLACTQTCATNADCPVGSQGQRCNQQLLCRP